MFVFILIADFSPGREGLVKDTLQETGNIATIPSLLIYLSREPSLLLESIRTLGVVIGTREKHRGTNHSTDRTGGEMN